MAVPVVFILASNYSGSHLLASALGAHSACADIGELGNLGKFLDRSEKRSAGTRGRFAESPLFDGLLRLPEARWHAEVHERLAASGRPAAILVDNSKRLDWIEQASATGAIEPRLVHLIRDPRALARRWRDTFRKEGAARRIRWREAKRAPRHAAKILTGPETGVYGWRWLRENAQIANFVAQREGRHARVAYESLMATPQGVLADLMVALGLTFEPGQLSYGASEPLGTSKPAWAEANARSRWVADDRWRHDLDAPEQAAVCAIAPLAVFLARLGYRFGPQGLEPVH